MNLSPESRVKKRSSNACQRCRRHKIKCSGSQPCDTCRKRKLNCVIDDRAQKVLVARGYIEDLQRKVTLLEQSQELPSLQTFSDDFDRPNSRDTTGLSEGTEWDQAGENDPEISNPLSTGPSTFISTAFGRTFYLGTSSNWSFARKVLSMIHEHLYDSPLPTDRRHFDETAYELGWDGLRTSMSTEVPMVPTVDFSMYLLNAVKFHVGQLFHIFDEPSFMEGLYAYHENPDYQTSADPLWYILYLLLLAFGKAFTVQRGPNTRPAGCEFFVKALQLLPDLTHLNQYPMISTEILCCVALYLQSLDFRSSAYGFIGQAVRLSLASGMHTNMPIDYLGGEALQRRRRIWWTVYILDRQMTSLMGLPQSIEDNQIYHELPLFPESPHKVTALSIEIKMCQIIADVNRTVYGVDGRLNRKFLSSTKTALGNTANLDTRLQESHRLGLDESSPNGVSRLSAHLHLIYHQCIVLATRPLLFCFLKMRLQSFDPNAKPLTSSAIVCKLLQVCVESAKQMLNILVILQKQTLLDSFLPFDLESTFVSALVLLLAPFVDPYLLDDSLPWLQKAYDVLDEMIYRGNQIAAFRRSDLEQLHDLLRESSGQCDRREEMISHMSLLYSEESQFGDAADLTTADIMAVAESIDSVDVDWMAHAVTENCIW